MLYDCSCINCLFDRILAATEKENFAKGIKAEEATEIPAEIHEEKTLAANS